METLHEKIAAIIEPSLVNMGYSLVRVRLIEAGRRTLQIMAERTDGKNMTVEDCAGISRNVSALLDVEDPIEEMYTLEVSSPGIDRPLLKPADFERFTNFEAKIDSKIAIEGRKRFKGRIKAVEGEAVRVKTAEGAEVLIPFRNINTAKLLLTDELIDWYGKSAAAAN